MPRKPRVVIPKNPGELLKLAGDIYQHHQNLGSESPLRILDEPTWETVGPVIAPVLKIQQKIDDAERLLKELYGQRDPELEKLTDATRRSRDLLLAKHAANPAAIGPYGFDVIEAPKPAPKAKSTDQK